MDGQTKYRGRNIAPLIKQEIIQAYLSGISGSYDLSIKHGVSQKSIYAILKRYKQKNSVTFADDTISQPIMPRTKVKTTDHSTLQAENERLKRQLQQAQLKIEGYQIMGDILEKEYGIDLLKKVEAGQCRVSKKDTQK
jgi:transposase-like protein